jgi:NifU-like protein involved in Fe-S cluster formation
MARGFSDVVIDHFLHPRHTEPIQGPDGEGWSGSVETSRFMRIQVRLRDQAIIQASFATYGCAPAIAAGSYLCDWCIGRTPDEVSAMDATTLRNALGGLPQARHFCADLAVDALRGALHQAVSRPLASGPGPPGHPVDTIQP